MAEGDLDVRLARCEWRLEALDRWRDRVEQRMTVVEDRTGALARADEIAKIVAERVDGNRKLQLSSFQKIGGLIAGALFAAAQIKGLL